MPGDFAYSLEHDGLRIGIVGLNTAFLQLQGGDYLGKLAWDVRQLDLVCGGAVDDWQRSHDFCLLLTHHGMDWLTADAQKHGDSEIAPAGRFALHLFGHQHETGIASIRRGGNPNASRLFQGCSVFGMELFGEPPKPQRSHGYAAGRIQIDEQGQASLRFWPRMATHKTGSWRFVPDHENAHLLDDQGTAPESLAIPNILSLNQSAAHGVRDGRSDDLAKKNGVPERHAHSCFISYSSKDEEFAQRLHSDLQNNGVRCWFAPEDIKAGRKLHEQIGEAINIHEKLLLILSEHSMGSEWVKTEIAVARKREVEEKQRVLFPIRLVDYVVIQKWECFEADIGRDSAREVREYFIPDFSRWNDHDAYKKAFDRLLRDLKNEASNTRATPSPTLPPRRPFFGRATELDTIANYLRPDHVGWGVVLDGPGGIGKTALALEAAYRAPAEHYPLKLFVTAKSRRLDPDGPRHLHDNRFEDFHALLTAIGLGLGRDDIQKTPQANQPELIRLALASQRALLVLDNLESLSKEERRRVYDLLEFLPPACKAIVTSRRRDETAARTLRLDRLDFSASQQLLAGLGELWLPVARLTEAEQQRLYAETGGNPLLLTWTAGQLDRAQSRCRSVEQAIARLKEAHALHTQNETNDPLEFIFGDLLDTFTPDETAVLAALAHFTEPARLAWLLPLAELTSTTALTALDDLRNRALLLEDNDTWLLPPLAVHFLRQRRPEAVGAAGQRLEAEAYALAVQHGGGSEKAPFTELEKVWPTVQAALPLLLAGDNKRLQTVCDALDFFLDFCGHWEFLLNLHLEAEAKALAAGDYYNAGSRAYQAGWVHYLLGKAEAMLDCAERCAQHWQQTKASFHKQAGVFQLRGIGYRLLKDYPTAGGGFN